MKKELFDELLESVREGGAILRGERAPSRIFRRKPEGSARILLKVVERHPEAVFDVVSNSLEGERQIE